MCNWSSCKKVLEIQHMPGPSQRYLSQQEVDSAGDSDGVPIVYSHSYKVCWKLVTIYMKYIHLFAEFLLLISNLPIRSISVSIPLRENLQKVQTYDGVDRYVPYEIPGFSRSDRISSMEHEEYSQSSSRRQSQRTGDDREIFSE